jgi:hypothetical protein
VRWVVKMIEKGAHNWDEAFQAACKAGNADIIMMLHSRVRNNNNELAVVCDMRKSSSICINLTQDCSYNGFYLIQGICILICKSIK